MSHSTFVGGLNIPTRSDDALLLLQNARQDGFDFIATSLPHSPTLSRRDITLVESKWWSTSIIGMVNSPPDFNCKDEHDNTENDNMSHAGVSSSKPIYHPDWNVGNELVNAMTSGGDGNNALLAEKYMDYMLDWAGHMNIPAVILPSVPTNNNRHVNYGRYLAGQVLKCSANNVNLWVRVPFHKDSIQSYQILHRLCDGASNLGCMVMFDESMIKMDASELVEALGLLHQLIGCNLRAVSFPTNVFLTNKRGFPALPKSLQFLFMELLKRLGRTCRVMVEGVPLHRQNDHDEEEEEAVGALVGKSEMKLYLEYLRHLRTREEVTNVIDTDEAKMEDGYLDHLQSALQPLGDNLEFSTYEVFEKDPVKYARYQNAIELALIDKMQLGHLRSIPIREDSNEVVFHVTIFVVGAGRGPLVNSSLKAVERVNASNGRILGKVSTLVIQPTIIAVEKNPSAILYLNSLKNHDSKWSNVEVVHCDMRHASKHPYLSKIIDGYNSLKADIVVSELLGSFGDNELSPECLDGFQQSGLMKENGISIPQKYTSYLAPVTSMKLHAEAKSHAFYPSVPAEGPEGKPCGAQQAMETPYVVRAHAASQLHKELPCWEFNHPFQENGKSIKESASQVNNERSASLHFDLGPNGIAYGSGYQKSDNRLVSLSSDTKLLNQGHSIHGFLGTFHCVLYQSITNSSDVSTISIAPSTFSVGMFSWFPLYFPLKEPQFVPPGASVCCNIWRKCDNDRVWYEWCSEVRLRDQTLSMSSLHNPNGRSCIVRL
mmetsp:Transcript_1511/g.2767  ORF Transcript_1511/g.2767 Transcript_1511/m.2767 type:complete len:772 (-) Transcript_1511:40-2355(-)